jgi:hypothetical protein
MRLINTTSLELELLSDPVPEPYAILSHRWGPEEILFADMLEPKAARRKAGFAKIDSAALLARKQSLSYLWVDTCCIDKSSSAELSEAINSMFNWYKGAAICYAFLADLGTAGFESCEWFTRGWTLQELIAPRKVDFYDEGWNYRGSKLEFAAKIEAITGIDQLVLQNATYLPTVALANRMSWAAKRKTTRIEDEAYCLMGIFDVNMPMIYGEGAKAFTRLQEEILKKTTDLSIFGWKAKAATEHCGILAESPSEFENCAGVRSLVDQFSFRDEIIMTNRGVRINTGLWHAGGRQYMLDLHCQINVPRESPSGMGIWLIKSDDEYFRYQAHSIATVRRSPNVSHGPKYFLLSRKVSQSVVEELSSGPSNTNYLRYIPFTFPLKPFDPRRSAEVEIINAVPEIFWYRHGCYFDPKSFSRFVGFVRFRVTSRLRSVPQASEERQQTELICVCETVNQQDLRIRLYSEREFHEKETAPASVLNPFRNTKDYGPQGDPFSLSRLCEAREGAEYCGINIFDESHHFCSINARVFQSMVYAVNGLPMSRRRVEITVEDPILPAPSPNLMDLVENAVTVSSGLCQQQSTT